MNEENNTRRPSNGFYEQFSDSLEQYSKEFDEALYEMETDYLMDF